VAIAATERAVAGTLRKLAADDLTDRGAPDTGPC
jgi:hypothetical protein